MFTESFTLKLDDDSVNDDESRSLCNQCLDFIINEIDRVDRNLGKGEDNARYESLRSQLSVVSQIDDTNDDDSELSQNVSITETLIDSVSGPFYSSTANLVSSNTSQSSSQDISSEKYMRLENGRVNKMTASDSEEDDRIVHHIFESKLRDFWENCKRDVEKVAEKRAKLLVRSWKRDCLTLDSAIEATLKEYGDMHEKALAVKEMFEYEKENWKRDVMAAAWHAQGIKSGGAFSRKDNNFFAPDNEAANGWQIDYSYELDDDNVEMKKRKRSEASDEDESTPSRVSLLSTLKRQKFKMPSMSGK